MALKNVSMLTAFVQAIPLRTIAQPSRNVLKVNRLPKSRMLTTCSANPHRTPISPPLQGLQNRLVNRKTGKAIKYTWDRPDNFSDTMEIVRAEIELPADPISSLNDLWPRRGSRAVVYGNAALLDPRSFDWLNNQKVVIFAHGIAQNPDNYRTILQTLVVNGYVVIAPKVNFIDILSPGAMVESVDVVSLNFQDKIKTALSIDIGRAIQMASGAGCSKIHTIGHGIGANSLMMYHLSQTSNKLHEAISSVSLLAILAHYEQGNYYNKYFNYNLNNDAHKLNDIPVLLLHGEDDKISNYKNSENLFTTLSNRKGFTGYGLFEEGYHFGFEDSIRFPMPNLNQKMEEVLNCVFLAFDYLIFKRDTFNLGVKAQLKGTTSVLETFIANSEDDQSNLEENVRNVADKNDIVFQDHSRQLIADRR